MSQPSTNSAAPSSAADQRDALIAELRSQLAAANARADRAEARGERLEAQLDRVLAKLDGIEAASSSQVRGEFAALTIAEAVDRYLGIEQRRLEDGGSWQSTRARLNAIKRHIGFVQVSKASQDTVDEYRNLRARETTHLKRPPSKSAMTQELFALNRVLNWAVERRKLSANPIRGFEPERSPSHRRTRYSPEEIESVIAVAGPYLRALILCTYESGLRPGETRLLERDQINWRTGHLALRWDQDKENGEHDVQLSDRALDALRLLPTPLSFRRLFTNPKTGRLWARTTLISWWDRAAAEVGLQGAPGEKPIFYVLRHGLADDLADANVPVQTAAAVLRHKDWKMQQRHYVQRRLNQLGDALDAVALLRRQRLGPNAMAIVGPVSDTVRKGPRRSDQSFAQATNALDRAK